MAFDALAVANYFLDKAEEEGRTLTPLALQKLVYFAHGWHLAITGQPLITQRVEAWEYGPVIRDIYSEFREFGREPITRKATRFDFPPGTGSFAFEDVQVVEPKLELSEATKSILDKVWDVYKKFSAIQLSNLTHAIDSPWERTREQNPGTRASIISDELIKNAFQSQASANAAKREPQPA